VTLANILPTAKRKCAKKERERGRQKEVKIYISRERTTTEVRSKNNGTRGGKDSQSPPET
jgi:hypothetical protein